MHERRVIVIERVHCRGGDRPRDAHLHVGVDRPVASRYHERGGNVDST
jgi:hypothetical protein